MTDWRTIQQHLGITADNIPGQGTADAVARALGIAEVPVIGHVREVTLRGAAELISHEAIVQEAYKDSVGIWTWGIGVTNASGHVVYPRYKDNPQTIQRCLEIFVWLLREKYAPDVLKAFGDYRLTEAQFAAALSFHYNTGAILTASWVKLWQQGKVAAARESIMEWKKPASIVERRGKERDLFFDGKWSGDGKATVYPVSKPSYAPAWGKASRIDIMPALKLAGGWA